MTTLRLTGSLFELTSLMRAHARPILRQYDLNFTQFQTLAILLEGEHITQHQLAEYLAVSDAAVSRMLAGMQEDGLVKVNINPQHLRQRLVSLTTKGRELAVQVTSALEGHFKQRTQAAGLDLLDFTRQLDLLKLALQSSSN